MPLRALSRCAHVTSGPAAVGGVSHRSVATHCHRRGPVAKDAASCQRRGPVAKKIPLLRVRSWGRVCSHAGVAELADAYGSGPYESNLMKVQLLSPAPLHADASWSNPEAFFVGSSRLCEGFAPTRPPRTSRHGESAPARRAPSRRKCPGPRTSRDGESAPARRPPFTAKVPRRFWGT